RHRNDYSSIGARSDLLRPRRSEDARMVRWIWLHRHDGILHGNVAHSGRIRISGHRRGILWRIGSYLWTAHPRCVLWSLLQHDRGRCDGSWSIRLLDELDGSTEGRRL